MRAGFIQFAGFAVLALLVGCSTSMQPVTPPGSSSVFQDDGSSRGKIKHVVIIVQENRSFDNFFDCFPGTDCVKSAPPPAPQPEPTKRDNPCPVMPTPSPGPTATPIQLQLNQKLSAFDIDHSYCAAFVQDYDGGKMDGFYWNVGGPAGVAKAYAYRVVAEKQIQPYWDLAQQYVLADRTFPTQASGSFTAHQDLIRGDTVVAKNESVIDYPWNSKYAPLWGCDDVPGSVTSLITSKSEYLYNKGPFPCFSYETIRDTLDAKDVSWKYYVPTWPNNEGQYWNSTAIFILWDDWGGYYDHIPPPQVDYQGLGVRVPMIVVSPYAKKGYISHVQYEFGSLLKFAEYTFGLPSLGTTDVRANNLTDAFNFKQKPRTFTPIKLLNQQHDRRYFLMRPPSNTPVDTQ
jgi:phospholipase C